MERRLSAILVSDVVGYSRLMERDEAGTFQRLRAHRQELFEPEIAKHNGRVFKLTGDGLLAEFASVVDAVACAVELQHGMKARNGGLADSQRIDLRIGINLGDVIVEGEDRHGDGVNIAARLQQLAEPAGIAVSRTVFDHVKHKLPVHFQSLGEQRVKNITEPVEIYRWVPDGIALKPRLFGRRPRFSRRATPILLAALLLLFGGGAFWHFHTSGKDTQHRLSIVVLPFTNLGDDPNQKYFADAITNDLTTDLSRIQGSFVVAPQSAAAFAGRQVDIKQLGRELGVRYVLEGSLRRAENRVRVNALLIDAVSGATVWSERFDGDWTKSMQLQDEITGRLARRLDLELTDQESRRAQLERPSSPDAVDLTMRGWSVLNQSLSRKQLAQARELFERALAIDPKYPKALVGWSTAPTQDLARADAAIGQVLAAFPDDAMAHFVKGDILRASGKNFEAAIAEYKAAIAINPSLAPAYAALGGAEIRAGRSEEAFASLQTAIRLSPRDPFLNIWYFYMCHAYTHLAKDDAASEWCRRSVAVEPFWMAYVDLASAYAWTGKLADARAAVAELLKLKPGYTVYRWAHEGFSDNPVFLAQYQRITVGLRKAGLPEG